MSTESTFFEDKEQDIRRALQAGAQGRRDGQAALLADVDVADFRGRELGMAHNERVALVGLHVLEQIASALVGLGLHRHRRNGDH